MRHYRTHAAAKKEADRRTAATGVVHKVVASLPPHKPATFSVVRNPFAVNEVRVYTATCKCGFMPLNTNPTYEAACHTAQAHKDLNPNLCSPTIFASDVPAALAR